MDAHANFAYGVVAIAPSPAASGLTLSLSAGQGALLPTAPFNATVWPNSVSPLSSNAEIVRVTAVVGDDLTIVRAQEGTSARTILVGDQFAATITVKTVTDIENAIPSIAGLISAINVSAGATSNNLSALTFDNSNGVSFGLTGSVVTATVATNYQSQGAYLTTAALSQDSSKYAGTNGAITGGSITVNNSGVSVNLPAYLTTAMASNRGSDFVQATAAFAGTNASGTIASNGISVSVAAPGAGGLSAINISAGTTSNNLTAVTFDDANGVSFGIVGSVVTATVRTNYLTTAMASNRGSDFVQATAVFNGTNATGTIASGAISVSVNPQSAQTQSLIAAVYDGANSISTGTVRFTNANGVSFSINGQTLSGSVAAGATATGNLGGVSLSGNTAGVLALISSGTAIFAGGNNITLSQNGQSVTISGPNVGGAQTGISGIVVSDATYTSGTVSFSNAGNITISSSVNGATQFIRLSGNAAQTNQSAIRAFGVSNTGQTAGNTGVSTGIDWVLAGSDSITLSQSTAGGGPNTVWVQHPAWITGQTQSSISISDAATSGTLARIAFTNLNGITLSLSTGAGGSHTVVGSYTVPTVTNSSWSISDAATSGTVARLAFTNLNGITLSLSTGAAGSHTIVGSHNALTSESTQFLALTLGGNTAGTTTFHASNNASLFLHGGANITLSGNGSSVTISGGTAAPSPVNFSAGTTSGDLGSVVFSDSNGISFGLNGSTITARANTVGTATTVTPVASANSVGTVTRWAAEDHRHAGVAAIGISNGNSSGTTGTQVGTYWLQGGNNVTLSQITSNNGSHTLVVSGANTGGAVISFFDNGIVGATALSNPGQMTLYVFPLDPLNEVFPGNMSVSTVFLNVTQSVSTAATWTNQFSIAFYSSVNSTQLTRVCSGSTSWGTNAGNMLINDSFGGTRWLTIHSSNFDVQPVFLDGVRYWCAIWNRTSNNAGSMSLNLYGFQTLGTSGARSGIMGLASVVNSSLGWNRFQGIYSVTFSTAMPAALAASDINKSVAQVLFMPQVILNNVATNIF